MSCWQKNELPSGLSTNTCEYACGGSSSAYKQQRTWTLEISIQLHIFISNELFLDIYIYIANTSSKIKNFGKDVDYN